MPGQDYKAFLRSHLGENQFHRGGIYDLEGNFVAHSGRNWTRLPLGNEKAAGGSAQPRCLTVVDLDSGNQPPRLSGARKIPQSKNSKLSA